MSFSHARKHYFKTLKSDFKLVFTILSSWVEASFGLWVVHHPLPHVLPREGSLPPRASCFPPANHRIPRQLMPLSERRCFQKISVSYRVKIRLSELNIHSTNIFKISNILFQQRSRNTHEGREKSVTDPDVPIIQLCDYQQVAILFRIHPHSLLPPCLDSF